MDPKEDDFASPVIVAPDDNSSPAATNTTTRVIMLPSYLHSNLQWKKQSDVGGESTFEVRDWLLATWSPILEAEFHAMLKEKVTGSTSATTWR
jgi:hypothetical protein